MKKIFVVSVVFLSVLQACSARPKLATDEPQRFSSVKEAVGELFSATDASDTDKLRGIFGKENESIFSSGDAVQDRQGREMFVRLFNERHDLEKREDGAMLLLLGNEEWPFPIPLRESDDGWGFDVEEGKEEIVNRRVGRNELEAIDTMNAYVQAQREYFEQAHGAKGSRVYAEKVLSSPGTKDGLFWPRKPKEQPSPLGPLVAEAVGEGYSANSTTAPRPFHGYRFRVLTEQGPAAPGGKKSYRTKSGELKGGFGLLAYPEAWGNSGVMTFMVGPDGVVYEKDLGEQTGEVVAGLTEVNPDPSWEPVEAE